MRAEGEAPDGTYAARESGLRRVASLAVRSGSGWIKALGDLLWPPVCAVCPRPLPLADSGSGPEMHFCSACWESVEALPLEICRVCGRPFYNVNLAGPEAGGPKQAEDSAEGLPARAALAGDHSCGDCLAAPPPYGLARSAVVYRDAVARSISRLKYYGDLSQVRVLADLARPLARALLTGKAYDAVLPLPVSSGRLAERGFNQALELALKIFDGNPGLIVTSLLSRPGGGEFHQAALSANERARAVKGCFSVKEPEAARGRHFLLFDDVFTSGATVSEATRTLRRAGAAGVDVLTVARAVRPDWR